MTFGEMHGRLLTIARERVGNGEITESQLARLMGVSQSHTHNVLKGARKISPEFADAILHALRLNALDLMEREERPPALPFRCVPLLSGMLGLQMRRFDSAQTAGFAPIPAPVATAVQRPLAMRLGDDPKAAPRFQRDDLVLMEQAIPARRRIEHDAVYLAMTAAGPRIRYVRQGVERIYLPSEECLLHPAKWESVPATGSTLLSVVLGRVTWLSRQLPQTDRQCLLARLTLR